MIAGVPGGGAPDDPGGVEGASRAGENAPPPGPEEPAGAAGESSVGAGVDFRDRWLRAEAELQNFRRRVQRDAEESRRAAEDGVLLELVSALDDLERALDSLPSDGPEPGWAQGVALVAQRIRDALVRHGVEALDPLGEPFDPATQEAILEVAAPEGARPGDVVQVVHKGYRRGSRELRAARVLVAREPGGADA